MDAVRVLRFCHDWSVTLLRTNSVSLAFGSILTSLPPTLKDDAGVELFVYAARDSAFLASVDPKLSKETVLGFDENREVELPELDDDPELNEGRGVLEVEGLDDEEKLDVEGRELPELKLGRPPPE